MDTSTIVLITIVVMYTIISYLITKKHYDRLIKDNYVPKEDYKKLLSQKKSSEVRTGQIAEQMAPFSTQWPYDPNRFRFLGDPIDGVSFNEDGIVLVEIKSGNARLSQSQRLVKQQIKEGKVKLVSFRINDDKTTLKIESEITNKEQDSNGNE